MELATTGNKSGHSIRMIALRSWEQIIVLLHCFSNRDLIAENRLFDLRWTGLTSLKLHISSTIARNYFGKLLTGLLKMNWNNQTNSVNIHRLTSINNETSHVERTVIGLKMLLQTIKWILTNWKGFWCIANWRWLIQDEAFHVSRYKRISKI